MERIAQKAKINDEIITFDYIAGDIVKDKWSEPKGIITRIDNPFVYIEWTNEEIKSRRGTRWLVSGVEYAE